MVSFCLFLHESTFIQDAPLAAALNGSDAQVYECICRCESILECTQCAPCCIGEDIYVS